MKTLVAFAILLLAAIWIFRVNPWGQSSDHQHEKLKEAITLLGGSFHVKGDGRFSYITLRNIDAETDLSFYELIPEDLRKLCFRECSIDLSHSTYENRFGRLKYLEFHKCHLGDSKLKSTSFPSLVGVSVIETSVSDQFFDEFSPLKLRKLVLADTIDVSNDLIKPLGTIQSLEEVVLTGNQNIAGQGLNSLGRLTKLKKLILGDMNLEGFDFSQVQFDSTLEYLDVRGTNMNSVILQTAHDLKNLRTLVLGGTDVSDDCSETIEKLRNLEFLGLDGTGVTSNFVKTAEGLPRLKTFLIDTTKLKDSDMPGWEREVSGEGGYTQLIKTT